MSLYEGAQVNLSCTPRRSGTTVKTANQSVLIASGFLSRESGGIRAEDLGDRPMLFI